jgi:predicted PurR-regulated permease PerM
VLLLPLIFFASILFQEVLTTYQSLVHGSSSFALIDHFLLVIENYIRTFVPTFILRANFSQYAETGLAWTLAHLDLFFSNIVSFTLDALLFLVAVYVFTRHGKHLRALAITWSPLNEHDDERMFVIIEHAVHSVIFGALLSSLVQGVLVGVGFALFGISSPVLWGAVAFVAALVPPLGSAIITVPAAIALLLLGHVGLGIGLLGWGTLVGLVDNIIKPIIMKKGTNIHPFIILLSIIGGIAYFGPLGFIEGPIVIAGFFALLELYPQIVIKESITKNEDHSVEITLNK